MDVGFAQIRDAAIDRATAYGGRAVAKVGAKTVHRERAAREFYPYRIEKMETADQSCRLSAASWLQPTTIMHRRTNVRRRIDGSTMARDRSPSPKRCRSMYRCSRS